MNPDLITFGRNLRRLRVGNRLTLRQLAEKTGIGRSTLSEYENAITDPSLTHVKIIADYFNVNIGWMVGEEDKMGRRCSC